MPNEADMKKVALLVVGFLFLTAIAVAGCAVDIASPNPGAEVVSSCVTCHTDKEVLQELAVEEEEEASEETTGEG